MHFQPPTLQRRFVGHVIRTLSVQSGTACEACCFDDDDCISVNLGPSAVASMRPTEALASVKF